MTFALALPLFTAGCLLGYALRGCEARREERRVVFSAQREGGYRFIDPLLECDASSDYLKNRELSNFKEEAGEIVKERLAASDANRISVYFRELHDGLSFRIGELNRFSPASLLKVPLLIAYLRMAERDPGLLQRRVKFEGGKDDSARQNFRPSRVIVPGEEYTVEELLRRMIVHSDNNASMLLRRQVDPRVLYKEYQDLGIADPKVESGDDTVTITEYAAFFRILFNASYISRDSSEKALALLSQSEFRGGLAAGVPPSVPVAHKFGERSFGSVGERQLHDCGIVYFPKHPYLLCVMSRGEDFERPARSIADVSATVYAQVAAQHGGH